jgi:sugar/nucleoside kinase (ribokinase family)
MAGIMAALCAGASPGEAALVGNLVASITVQQIGTTGTATRGQVLERLRAGSGVRRSPPRTFSSFFSTGFVL